MTEKVTSVRQQQCQDLFLFSALLPSLPSFFPSFHASIQPSCIEFPLCWSLCGVVGYRVDDMHNIYTPTPLPKLSFCLMYHLWGREIIKQIT